MDKTQIRLIQDGSANVAPMTDVAAQIFYTRLFELDPGLRDLFRGEMPARSARLMPVISAAMRILSDVPKLMPVAESLDRRAKGDDSYDRDCATVGRALLWTVREGVSGGFAPKTRTAWGTIHHVMAELIQRAATENSRPIPPNAHAIAPSQSTGSQLGIIIVALLVIGGFGAFLADSGHLMTKPDIRSSYSTAAR